MAVVGEYAPNLVIYDIPWPYDERLSSFQALRTARTGLAASTWMAITTSDRVVEVLGEPGVPVIAKPFELETFVETAPHWP